MKTRQKNNRHFSGKEIQMAIKYMKRCSILFMINEMQIKTAMKMPFSPITLSIIQKLTKIRSNRYSHTLLVEIQIVPTSGVENWATEAVHISKNNHYWKKRPLKGNIPKMRTRIS